jgi:hypothetical protein
MKNGNWKNNSKRENKEQLLSIWNNYFNSRIKETPLIIHQILNAMLQPEASKRMGIDAL